jgi:hypothetical protein
MARAALPDRTPRIAGPGKAAIHSASTGPNHGDGVRVPIPTRAFS